MGVHRLKQTIKSHSELNILQTQGVQVEHPDVKSVLDESQIYILTAKATDVIQI